jgi:SAM-dependent methyltransferase
MSSYSRQQLESWLKTLDIKADAVLDIGGCQLPVNKRTKSWDVKEYKLLDLKQPHEQKQKADIEFNINDSIAWIHNSKDFPDVERFKIVDMEYYEHFDSIFMLEVLEYVWNPVIAIENCNEFLKRGGLLYLSFHFLYPLHKPEDFDYLRYTPNGIIQILEENGFNVESFTNREMTKDGFNKFQEFISLEGMKQCAVSNLVGGMIIARKI